MSIAKVFSALTLLIFIYCVVDITSVPSENYEIHSDIFDSLNTQHPKDTIYQRLLDNLAKTGVPGAVMLIKTPKCGIWAGASGKADVGSNVPMQINYIGRIGSITKMFTAVTIMRLIEQGKLTLDEKASTFLPQEVVDNIKNCNDVTIHQLLNHTSGIVDYVDNLNFILDCANDPAKNRNWKDLLHYVYGKAAYCKPGIRFHYSNTNYLLLGQVIKGAYKEEYSRVLQKEITDPLHLACTFYNPDAPIPRQLVRGYMDYHNDGKITDITDIHSHTKLYGDAGVITNVYDLMIFCEALFTGNLLADTTLNKMKEWVTTDDEELAGLGIFSKETFYGQYIGHSGYTFGFKSQLFYFPEKKITFIILANGSFGSIDKHLTDFVKINTNTHNELFDVIFSGE